MKTLKITIPDEVDQRLEQFCRQSDRRGGVASDGFGDQMIWRKSIRRQLAEGLKRVLFVGDDVNPVDRRQGQKTLHRLLDEGFLARDIEELFGVAFPAERPEPLAAATGKDDADHGIGNASVDGVVNLFRISRSILFLNG